MLRTLYNRAFGSGLGDNAGYISVEAFWGSLFAGAHSFAGAYAIKLGATNTEVTLLSALPALTAALILIPAGHFLQGRMRPERWILGGLTIYRVGTLLFVLLPWMDLGLPRGTLFVIIIATLTIPMHFFNLGFIPMLAEAIPDPQRTDGFTARNVILGGGMTLSTFALGLWLGKVAYPANYQIMFFLAFLVAMLSLYYLGKVKLPAKPPAPPAARAAAQARSPLRRATHFFTSPFKGQGFSRIFVNSFLFSVGLWGAGPLFLLYTVRNLGASEAWLGAYGSVGSLATIFGYLFWRRLIARSSEARVLKYVVVLMGLYPLAVGATGSLTLILILVGLNGVIAAGFNLSHFNTFLKVIPESQRHNYTALYLAVANVGAFIAPLVAVYLADRVGLNAVLMGCGLLTVLGALSFWVWPVVEAHMVEGKLQLEEANPR